MVFFVNMVAILIMSAKLVTQGPLKIKVFWKNGYDAPISDHYVTSKTLSCNSINIVIM